MRKVVNQIVLSGCFAFKVIVSNIFHLRKIIMRGFFVKFFCAVLLFLFHIRSNRATKDVEVKCIEREKKALLMFKQGIQYDNGRMLSTWRDNENGDCCNWRGVRCSNKTGQVQALHLRGSYDPEYYLIGIINISVLIELHDMKYLDLSYNSFYGSDIPEVMGSFSNLRYLNLSKSLFGGNIPFQLGKLSNLQFLDLYWNYLDGSIPRQLGNLSKLQFLGLGENNLVGVIPYSLRNLSLLHYLDLSYNSNLKMYDRKKFDAEWLSNLSLLTILDLSSVSDLGYSHHWFQGIGKFFPKLRELWLIECGLSLSHFPSNFSTSLVSLHLSYNNLTYTIFQWPSKLINSNLQELYLINCSLPTNNLTFPSNYFNFSSLVILDLSNNNLMLAKALNFNPNLQSLNLTNCNLSSNNLIFTSSNFNFSSLVVLDLSYNQLTLVTIFHWVSNFTFNLHELYLSGNLLEGPIPDDFGNTMNSLQILDLSNNKLQGRIPSSLGNISTLQRLSLSYNNLSGVLSSFNLNSSCCNRQALQHLELSNNRISGMLPDLALFSSLEELLVSNNQLIGEIPESLGLLHELKHLTLDGNSLKGVITEFHFTNLSNLRKLYLGDNSLTLRVSTTWVPPFQLEHLGLASCMLGPSFPNWIQTQSRLKILDVSDNGILDLVPEWVWPMLETLDIMNISHNHFVGIIPNLPLNLYYTPQVFMTSNNFEGAIPSFLLQASALHLSKNKFSNLIPFLCAKFEEGNLGILDLSNNLLIGQLPDCWSHMSSLTYVDLSNNNLSGEIPPSIGSLVNMEYLSLRNNSLMGELPSSLMNCTMLLLLDLSENNLIGPVPLWIGEYLGQLIILSLRMNRFSGSIPLHICHLAQVRLLDLSQNNLSKGIPPCLKNLTIMGQTSFIPTKMSYHPYEYYVTIGAYNFVDNSFNFYITLMWKGVENMFKSPESLLRSIDLSSNALTGEIPTEFVSLYGLVSFNVSRNNLSGKIPAEIGNLASLEFLDLSRNHLSGTIPSSLAHIDRLTTLDLSNNNLVGKIPTGTQLQSFNASSYEGNLDLCGKPLENKCPEDETPSPQVFDEDDDDSFFSQEFYISLGLGFAVGFWAFLGPILFNRSWRHTYYRLVNKVSDIIYAKVATYVAWRWRTRD